MAHFYATWKKHAATEHNEDVYLLGVSDKCSDDNTWVINISVAGTATNDKEMIAVKNDERRDVVWLGWKLQDGTSMTIGGVNSAVDVASADLFTRTYSVYQQSIEGLKASDVVYGNHFIHKQMTEQSAISFLGNGSLNLISQTGVAVGENIDNTLAIHAKNYSVTNEAYVNEALWSLGGIGDRLSLNLSEETDPSSEWSKYPTSANTDSNAVKADGTLTINSAVSGKIEAHSRSYSYGFQTYLKDTVTLVDTANGLSNKATGFKAKDIVLKGNVYGNINATSRVNIGSYTARNVSNNQIYAYGFCAENNVDASKSIWSGKIFVTANNSMLDATYAIDKDGKKVEGSSNANNNTFQAIGVQANNVTIGVLDWAYNTTDYATKIMVKDKDGNNVEEKFGYWNENIREIEEKAYSGLKQYSMMTVYNVSQGSAESVIVGDFATFANDVESNSASYAATARQLSGHGGVCFSGAYWNENGNDFFIRYKNESGQEKCIFVTKGEMTSFAGMYAYYSTDLKNATNIEITFVGNSTTVDINGKENVDLSVESAIGNVYANKHNGETVNSLAFTYKVSENFALPNDWDTLSDDDKTAYYREKIFGDNVFIVNYDRKVKVNDKDTWIATNKVISANDLEIISYDASSGNIQVVYVAGGEIQLSTTEEPLIEINAEYGVGEFKENYDTSTGSYIIKFIGKGSETAPDAKNSNDPFNISVTLSDDRGNIVKITDFDLKQDFIVWQSQKVADGYYEYTAIIDSAMIDNMDTFFVEIEDNAVITAKVVGNTIVGESYKEKDDDTFVSMTGNKFEAIGINANNKVAIGEVAAGTLIDIEVSKNKLESNKRGSGNSPGEVQITAVGIRGQEIAFNNFNGDINITVVNNTVTGQFSKRVLAHTVAGIKGGNLSVKSNLYGNINITVNQLGYGGTVSGNQFGMPGEDYIYVESTSVAGINAQTITVDGMISTNVTAVGDYAFIYGIRASQNIMAQGFNGSITISSAYVTGLYADKFISHNGEAFVIDGEIVVNGSSRAIGVALRSGSHVQVAGKIFVTSGTEDYCYAIKTDYDRSTSTAYCDDVVELLNGSIVTGNIALGAASDVNNLYINSGAKFIGIVDDATGLTNITFKLNEVKQDAIVEIDSESDVLFTSKKTITLDISNMQTSKDYILYQYDDAIKAKAEGLWQSLQITISNAGKIDTVTMIDGRVDTALENNKDVTMHVRYEDGKVIVSAEKSVTAQANKVYAIGLDTSTKDGKEEFSSLAINNELSSVASAIKSALSVDSSKVEGNLVANGQSANTSKVKLSWAQENSDSSGKLFKLVYTVKDAQGNIISTNTIVVDGKDYCLTSDIKDGKKTYSIYQYEIPEINNAYTVEWSVLDYSSCGTTGEVKSNANIDLVNNSNIGEVVIENLSGVNQNDPKKGMGSAATLFSWNPINSNFPIKQYNLRYIVTADNLTGATADMVKLRDCLWNIFENSSKYAKKDDSGNAIWVQVDSKDLKNTSWADATIEVKVNGAGDIMVRRKTSNGYVNYEICQKTTTATNILKTGLANRNYVFWQVQGVDSTGKTSSWTDGADFRVYDSDTVGPEFDGKKAEIQGGAGVYDASGNDYDFTNYKWIIDGDANKIAQAQDKGDSANDPGSGIRRYVLQYKDENGKWVTLKSYDANALFDSNGNWIGGMDFSFDKAGIYTIRVVAVDAAGNYAQQPGITAEKTVVAQDILAPTKGKNANVYYDFVDTVDLKQSSGFYANFIWDAATDGVSDNSIASGIAYYTLDFTKTSTIKDESTDLFNSNTSLEVWVKKDTYNGDTLVSSQWVKLSADNYEIKNNKLIVNHQADSSTTKYSQYRVNYGTQWSWSADNGWKLLSNSGSSYIVGGNNNLNFKYNLNITVTDKVGATSSDLYNDHTTNIYNSWKDFPADGQLDSPGAVDSNGPKGEIKKLNKVVVNVTKRESLTINDSTSSENSGGESSVQPAAATEEGGASTGTTTTLGTALEANVEFSWEDNYVDDSGVVRYILQVSDSNGSFFSNDVYTIIVLKDTDTTTQEGLNAFYQLYDRLSKIYGADKLRLVYGLETTTSNGVNSNKIVFGNKSIGATSGIFSGMKNRKWRVAAIDMDGNVAVGAQDSTFSFIDPELKTVITANSKPANPQDLSVSVGYDQKNYISTGIVTFNYSFLHEGFGVGSSKVVLTAKDLTYNKALNKKEVYSNTCNVLPLTGGTGNSSIVTWTLTDSWDSVYDGKYTLNVTNYSNNGKKVSTTAKETFIVDTVRPCVDSNGKSTHTYNNTNTSLYVWKIRDKKLVDVIISWNKAWDDTTDVEKYIVQFAEKGSNSWSTLKEISQKDFIANGQSITAQIGYNVNYQFQVYAVDSVGNRTLQAKASDYLITKVNKDSDIDANGRVHVYGVNKAQDTEYLTNQVVGGVSKAAADRDTDIFYVEKTANAGVMNFTIKNFDLIYGKGSSIKMTIRNVKTGKVAKTYTVKNNGVFSLLVNSSYAERYKVEISGSGNSAIYKYGFNYSFVPYVDPADSVKDNSVVNPTIINTDTLPAKPATDFKEFVGLGDKFDYYSFTAKNDGKYSIVLDKNTKAANSNLILYVYTAKDNGKSLKTVKKVKLGVAATSNGIYNLLLAAGEYMIKVEAPKASKGANVRYNLTVKGTEFPVDANINNNSDDNFGSASTNAKDWVGYGDQYDYKLVNIDQAGVYRFAMNKTGGYASMTVYSFNEASNKLKKVRTVNLKSNSYAEIVSVLAAGTYYIAVNAKNAKKGDSVSYNYNVKQLKVTADAVVSNVANEYAKDNSIAALQKNNVAGLLSGDKAKDVESYVSRLGVNDLTSWRRLEVDNSGSFNLSLQKTGATSINSNLTVTLYTLNASGSSLKKYKTLTVKAGSNTGTLYGLLLKEGNYYIQVSSKAVADSADFKVTVKNNFITQKEDISNNNYISATSVSNFTNGDTTISGWVGYEDVYDYYSISGKDISAGNYTITLNTTDALKVTLYTVNPAKGSLKALKTIKVSATNSATLAKNILLNGGDENSNYIIAVQSTNAKKGGNASYNIKIDNVYKHQVLTENSKLASGKQGVFTVTDKDGTSGYYNLKLSGSVKLYKYNDANGKLSAVKLKSVVNLTEGTYYMQNLSGTTLNVELTEDKILRATTLA